MDMANKINIREERHAPQKFRCHEAVALAEEENVTCETCSGLKLEGERYCLSCKIYWEDCFSDSYEDFIYSFDDDVDFY